MLWLIIFSQRKTYIHTHIYIYIYLYIYIYICIYTQNIHKYKYEYSNCHFMVIHFQTDTYSTCWPSSRSWWHRWWAKARASFGQGLGQIWAGAMVSKGFEGPPAWIAVLNMLKGTAFKQENHL
jgi:hypothetical protein